MHPTLVLHIVVFRRLTTMVMVLGCSSPVDETINGLMTSLSICSDDGKVSAITPPRSPPGQQQVLSDIPECDTPVSSFRRDNSTEE